MNYRLLCVVVLAIAPLARAQMMSNVWKENFAACHDATGKGGPATKSLLDDHLRGQDTDRRFFDAIRDASPAIQDHAFGPGSKANLDNPKVWGLVNYLRELQAKDFAKNHPAIKPDVQGVCVTSQLTYTLESVIKDGLSTPWSIEFIPSGEFAGSMLVTERPGTMKLRALANPKAELTDVLDLPAVRSDGQGGLLDVALHPKYKNNGWIYLSFSDEVKVGVGDKQTSLGMTKVVRGKLKRVGKEVHWVDQQTIFEAKPEHYLPGGVHFGSKFAFDPFDPTILFFGIGERGQQNFAQDLTRPNGKIHRVKDDGSIPTDNPFVGTKDAYESIWSFGHRNPQGTTFDLAANLWVTEHAPRGGDELNLITKGSNYGWPLVSFGINYNGAALRTPWVDTSPDVPQDSAIQMPTLRWIPSIATCGLCAVDAAQFPQWKGDLLCGGLAGQRVDRVRVRGDQLIEVETILEGIGRVRDIVNGPDGAIYVVLNAPDRVVRLTTTSRAPELPAPQNTAK